MNKYRTFRTKNDLFSILIEIRTLMILGVLTLIMLGLFLTSASLGEIIVHPLNVLQVFFGGGEEYDRLIVQTLRLPRIIIALFVGTALAVSGAILQGMIRNPLASPDLVGLTGGAGVGVVAFLAIFSNEDHALTVSIKWMPLSAFAGAILIGLLVYFLAYKNGLSPMRLILIGIGISAFTQAIITMLMILGPIFRASQANVWLTGSVYGSNWDEVKIIVPVVAALLLLSHLLARRMNAQELGDETAVGIGVHLERDRRLFLIIATALTGIAVSFAGGVGFVGLMAPHIARRLVGSNYGSLIPISAVIGAILVMGADLIGRTLFLPLEVPAGVFTASIGAPYFIYLLVTSNKSS
ncbi:FecCD family ABC transporter permease [Halobacillus yeomjeoni]